MSQGRSAVPDSWCKGLTLIIGLCCVLLGTMVESGCGRRQWVMSGELQVTSASNKLKSRETPTLTWRGTHDPNACLVTRY